ncbi:MAG TPA: ATP-binding protein, partial [Planctomycetota bacterium]|nr:ATP-binding protein [Planctomycetota bacterium]
VAPPVGPAPAAIVEETERLERLLGGIMDFVKPGEPRKVPTDVNLALQRALVQCEPAREGKRIRVTEKLEPALPPILADASQLEQAFANLIRNAFEAIPRAGEVTVASERGRDGVIVTISDTGRGIEPEQLARIFDPFFSTKSGGTGIGLTVAAKIVDDHGGRILIGSEPGKGTHARVRLPLGPASDRGEVAG